MEIFSVSILSKVLSLDKLSCPQIWNIEQEKENFSVSILSKVLSLDKLSCPQIWNIEQEKDGEKEKVGGGPAKLNEKKGDGDFKKKL